MVCMGVRTTKVGPGDVIAVPLAPNQVAAGLVLHVSKRIRQGMIVGFYDRLFDSPDVVRIDQLGGPFVRMPNYTSTKMVREGIWPIVGHSPELLSDATVPVLRAAYDLYLGDEWVGHVE